MLGGWAGLVDVEVGGDPLDHARHPHTRRVDAVASVIVLMVMPGNADG